MAVQRDIGRVLRELVQDHYPAQPLRAEARPLAPGLLVEGRAELFEARRAAHVAPKHLEDLGADLPACGVGCVAIGRPSVPVLECGLLTAREKLGLVRVRQVQPRRDRVLNLDVRGFSGDEQVNGTWTLKDSLDQGLPWPACVSRLCRESFEGGT